MYKEIFFFVRKYTVLYALRKKNKILLVKPNKLWKNFDSQKTLVLLSILVEFVDNIRVFIKSKKNLIAMITKLIFKNLTFDFTKL